MEPYFARGAGSLFFLLAVFCMLAGGCARLHDRQLADCSHNPVKTSLLLPAGKSHQLLLGIPRSHGRPPFGGHIHIEEEQGGKTICDFDFSSHTTQTGNWLDNHGLDSYILTWNNVDWRNTKPGQRYRLTVDASLAPPKDASLWLFWVQ